MPPSKRQRCKATEGGYQRDKAYTEASQMPIPSEIIHMVCKYLQPSQVANVRLACKALAQIGFEYLMPIVHLKLNINSYGRLRFIAEHPILSKHVYEIRYESDFLMPIAWEDFKSFRMTAPDPEYWLVEWACQDYNDSQFKSAEECKEFENGKLKAAYQVYQGFIADQILLQQQFFRCGTVSDLLLRLPRLQILRTGKTWAHDRLFTALQAPLDRPSVESICGDRGDWYWPGCFTFDALQNGDSGPLTATLLLGLAQGRSSLQELELPHLHWLVFNQTDSVFDLMKRLLCNLRRLKIRLMGPRRGVVEFAECLRKKRLHQFLASCPNLVDLDLSWFGGHFYPNLDLRHWLDSFHWHALTDLRLGDFAVSQATLTAFAAVHSASLQRLSLRDISLTEGTWYSTLIKMRNVLRLKEASVSGQFDLGEGDDEDCWWMYPHPERQPGKQPYGEYIKEYLEDHSRREMRLDILIQDGYV